MSPPKKALYEILLYHKKIIPIHFFRQLNFSNSTQIHHLAQSSIFLVLTLRIQINLISSQRIFQHINFPWDITFSDLTRIYHRQSLKQIQRISNILHIDSTNPNNFGVQRIFQYIHIHLSLSPYIDFSLLPSIIFSKSYVQHTVANIRHPFFTHRSWRGGGSGGCIAE